MLVVVLVVQSGGRAIKRIAVEAEILRTQALAGFFIGSQVNERLTAALDRDVGRVVGIKAQAGVVEVVPGEKRRTPIDDPASFRTEAVVDLLLGFANVDAIDEAGNGNESRADVVVLPVIGEMQAIAVGLEALGGSGVVIAVALVSGTEGVGIGLAVLR